MEKLWSYYTLIGAGGMLTNYGQIAMDVADRSRFRTLWTLRRSHPPRRLVSYS